MKILLVRPHLYLKIAERFHAFLRLEPLDLELVAAGIDRRHEVRILDMEVVKNPVKAFEKWVREFAPDVIGFGGYSNQAEHVKMLAKRAREMRPNVLIITGGVHATIAPQEFKLPGVIDVVVRGDGVSVTGTLVDEWEASGTVSGSEFVLPVQDADFDEKAQTDPPILNAKCIQTRPRRELVDPTKYYCVVGGDEGARLPTLFPQVASMRTSVGCPHRCSFCVVHFLANGKYLQRTPEDVVDEIAELEQEYIYFVDDEMFINAKRATEIGRLLKERGIRKKYISWARADTICDHQEMFAEWKEIGLETLYVGLESLDESYLADYNKGVDPSINRRAVEMLRELKIGLHAAFIVNPDFETEDFLNLRKTIDFVSPAEITFTVFSPSPGTELFAKHRDEFICDDPYLFYDCMHTIMPTKLPLNQFYRYFSLLYLFAFRKNPWRAKRIKVPLRDMIRLLKEGMKCGYTLRNIYKDYDRALW